MRALAVDTSLAIPLLLEGHEAHRRAVTWLAGRRASLSGHALVETYSVLTRAPQDLRLAPADAAQLIVAEFAEPLVLTAVTARRIPELLGRRGIWGGAVYDALVGLAAVDNGARLATRDRRARQTYERVEADIEFVQ